MTADFQNVFIVRLSTKIEKQCSLNSLPHLKRECYRQTLPEQIKKRIIIHSEYSKCPPLA